MRRLILILMLLFGSTGWLAAQNEPQSDFDDTSNDIFYEVGVKSRSFNNFTEKSLAGNTKWSRSASSAVFKELEYQINDDWLLSPLFRIPNEDVTLTINYRAVNTNRLVPIVYSVWFVEDEDLITGQGATSIVPKREYGYVASDQKDSLVINLSAFKNREGKIGVRIEHTSAYAELSILGFSIKRSPACAPISWVQNTRRTDTEVELTWGGQEGTFEIKYADIEFYPSDEPGDEDHGDGVTIKSIENILDQTKVIDGLTKGKKYYFYVRRVCGEDNYGKWERIIVRTTQTINQFPYAFSFDVMSNNVLPEAQTLSTGAYDTDNWFVLDGNGDCRKFRGAPEDPNTFNPKPPRATFPSMSGTSGPRNQWLISPRIAVPGTGNTYTSFSVSSGGNARDVINVRIAEVDDILIDPTKIDTAVFSHKIITELLFNTGRDYKPISIDLTPYAGKNVYIAIQHVTPDSYNYAFGVKEFRVDNMENVSPKNFILNSISASNGAILSWDAVPGADSYSVFYATGLADPSIETDGILHPKTTETDASIRSDLVLGANYYFYLRANFPGNKYSMWVGPIIGYVECETFNVPFVETMDGWISVPDGGSATGEKPIGCWSYVHLGHERKPGISVNHRLDANTGSSPWTTGKGVYISNTGNPNEDNDRYLISPLIQFPENGVVMSYQISAVTEDIEYSVMISTTDDEITSFRTIFDDKLSKPTENQIDWKLKTVNIVDKQGNNYANEQVYLAFHIKNNAKGGIKIDDITLNALIVGCYYPDNIRSEVVNSTSTDVRVKWEGNAAKYELAWHSQNFNPAVNPYVGERKIVGGNMGQMDQETIITGLQPGATYFVWIRALCGVDETPTRWEGPHTIIGSCGGPVVDFPYTQDFDRWADGQSPNPNTCWITNSGTQREGFTGMKEGSSSVAAYSATTALAGDKLEEWLISPRMKIDENLSLSFQYKTSTYLTEKFYVIALRDNDTKRDTIEEVNIRTYTYRGFYADLSKYIGEEIKIAIVHATDNWTKIDHTSSLYVENFRIDPAPCAFLENVQDVYEDEGNFGRVRVSWEGNSPEGYEIAYCKSNDYFYASASKMDPRDRDVYTMLSVPAGINDTVMAFAAEATQMLYYARPKCTGNDNLWSGPFYTNNCKTIKISEDNTKPRYTEEFTNWRHFPWADGCWQVINADSSGHSFVTTDWALDKKLLISPTGKSDQGVMVFKNTRDGETNWNNWLISPAFEIEGEDAYPIFEFAALSGAPYASTHKENIKVYIANSPDTNSLKNYMVQEVQLEYNSGRWTLVQVNVGRFMEDNPSLQKSPLYMAIQQCSPKSESAYLFIDDFRVVDLNAYNCLPPINSRVSKTGAQSVKLEWDDLSGAPNYHLRYSTDPFIPNGGNVTGVPTVPRITTTGGGGDYYHELKGLAKGQIYYYYIAPGCNKRAPTHTELVWTGPFSFKTDCDPYKDFPYEYNFEDWSMGVVPTQDCWTIMDRSGDINGFTGAGPANGSGLMYLARKDFVDSIDEWIISPAFIMPSDPEVSFNFATDFHNTTNPENFMFKIGRTKDIKNTDMTYNLDKFDTLATYADKAWPAPGGRNVKYDPLDLPKLENYIGDTVYFAFHLNSEVYDVPERPGAVSTNTNSLFFKDFKITSINPCAFLPQNLKVTPYKTSASVTWERAAFQTRVEEWDVYYWEIDNFGTIIGDTNKTITTETNAVLSYLFSDRNYMVMVRAVCDDDVKGSWTNPYPFRTLVSCIPPSGIKIELGKTEVTVTWTNDEYAYGYDVSWNKAGSADIMTEFVPGGPNGGKITLTDLDILQSYELKIIKKCQIAEQSAPSIRDFTTMGDCLDIDESSISSQTTQSNAIISWTEPLRYQKYEYSYKKLDAADWGSTSSLEKDKASVTLSSLDYNTDYIFRIRTECDNANNYSEYVTYEFRTQDMDRVLITALSNNNDFGTVTGTDNYPIGHYANLTATPKDGYELVYWKKMSDGKLAAEDLESYEPKAVADETYTAMFRQICDKVTDMEVVSSTKDSVYIKWSEVDYDDAKYRVYIWAEGETPSGYEEIATPNIVLKGYKEGVYMYRISTYCVDNSGDPKLQAPEVPGTISEFEIFEDNSIANYRNNQKSIKLKPNPAKAQDVITVQLGEVEGKVDWFLYDAVGRMFKRGQERNVSEFTINLNGLASGNYIVRFEGEGWQGIEKIIVTK